MSGCKVSVFQSSLSGLHCLFTLGHNVQRYGAWLIFMEDTFWPLRILFGGRKLQKIRNLAMHYNACCQPYFGHFKSIKICCAKRFNFCHSEVLINSSICGVSPLSFSPISVNSESNLFNKSSSCSLNASVSTSESAI